MTDPTSAVDTADAERFSRVGIAPDAKNAGRTRVEFARWLAEHFALDRVRAADLVLAANEALANAAEFAYRDAGQPGTIGIRANYHADDQKLTVTVSDEGSWRVPEPQPADRSRGRGIPLMRELSDALSIETSPGGTRVRLEWLGVTRRDTAR